MKVSAILVCFVLLATVGNTFGAPSTNIVNKLRAYLGTIQSKYDALSDNICEITSLGNTYEVMTAKVEPTSNTSGQFCDLYLKTDNNFDVIQLTQIMCLDIDDFHLGISNFGKNRHLAYFVARWESGQCSTRDIEIEANTLIPIKIYKSMKQPKRIETMFHFKANKQYLMKLNTYGDDDKVQEVTEDSCTSKSWSSDPFIATVI